MKGCEVYFSGTFSWTSPLSDRKVPTKLQGRRSRRDWEGGSFYNVSVFEMNTIKQREYLVNLFDF